MWHSGAHFSVTSETVIQNVPGVRTGGYQHGIIMHLITVSEWQFKSLGSLSPPPPPGASRFTTSLYLTASEEGQHSVTAAAVAAATAATAVGSPRGGTTGGDSTAESAFAHSAWVAEAAAAGVAAASGVEVTFTVRCGAGLPWPMNQVEIWRSAALTV